MEDNNKRAKYFLYGYYGFGNLGDDLLFKSVVDHIRSIDPFCNIVVRSHGEVIGYADDKRIHFLCCESILSDAAKGKLAKLFCYSKLIWGELAGCKSLVFGGGTLFHSRSGELVNMVLIALFVLFARLRGASVFALGVGVGVMPNLVSKLLMAFCVFLSKDFVVRDVTSLENISKIYLRDNVRSCPDLVFTLSNYFSNSPVFVPEGRRNLAITLASGDLQSSVSDYPGFCAQFPLLIEKLCHSGWVVKLFVFQDFKSKADSISDALLFDRVCSGCKTVSVVKITSQNNDVVEFFKDIDVVLGMRFHSLIISAMLGISFVAFGRDSKIFDFAQLLSMPSLKLDQFSSDVVCDEINSARQRAIPKQIINRLCLDSQNNFLVFDRDNG